MTRRMTNAEAEDFLWAAFDAQPDAVLQTHVEAYVTGAEIEQVQRDWESYLAIMPRDGIDPETIEITPDEIEGMGIPCVKIIIKIEVAA